MSDCFCGPRHCSPPPLLDSPVQTFEISVPMDSAKERSRALTVAAEFRGVHSVGIEGSDRNKIVVVGKGVDPVRLTLCLRKKVGCLARIDKVEENKVPVEPEDDVVPPVSPRYCYSETYVVGPVPEYSSCTIL